ncbi:hypothetical protein NT6N_21000 [Oceaniferula spumae]|uniref:Peptidase S9 n=1 Tax=Oceaniferula spumae TaxID=2979115 RepID=A0AAT9FM18_9BACT
MVTVRISSLVFLASCAVAIADVAPISSTKDYIRRMQVLGDQIVRACHNTHLDPQWSTDGSHLLLHREVMKQGKWEHRLELLDASTNKIVSESLWKELGPRVKEVIPEGEKWTYGSRGIQAFKVDGAGMLFRFKRPLRGWWRYEKNTLVAVANPKPSEQAPRNPRAASGEVRVQGGKVWFKPTGGKERSLGDVPADGNYEANPVWAPDGVSFYLNFQRPGQRRMVTVVESSPDDQLQPKTHAFRYDKPGDRVDLREPHVYFTDGRAAMLYNRSLVQNPFYIAPAVWSKEGKYLEFEITERGYGRQCLVRMNVATGKQQIMIDEKDDRFIHLDFVRYRRDLKKSGELLWASDRDGWRHLYLLDSETYQVKSQITKGDWHFRKMLYIDEENRVLYLMANGREKDQDPYHLHAYRVNFDGSNLTRLTEGDGTHKVTLSADKKWFLDEWSRVDKPHVWQLRRLHDGKLVRQLGAADTSGLKTAGVLLPERFHCKDRNGKFDIWGVIHYPADFDPAKKYPVLEQIYAGPQGAFVPKSFTNYPNELTRFGFVVVQIDGLGTAYRAPDFSKFAYKNLVDSGFPDRIKWMREAAKSRPWMDLTRVGIFGGSAGGQSAMGALLHHSDFYKAAVADCGCHDNRVDKIWWNEQWMDWPVGPHYQEQSNVTNAHKLEGNLLLSVGELDRNVDPASTMQVVNALIKADKDFELLVVPGASHHAGELPYMRRKRMQFFKKHLGE